MSTTSEAPIRTRQPRHRLAEQRGRVHRSTEVRGRPFAPVEARRPVERGLPGLAEGDRSRTAWLSADDRPRPRRHSRQIRSSWTVGSPDGQREAWASATRRPELPWAETRWSDADAGRGSSPPYGGHSGKASSTVAQQRRGPGRTAPAAATLVPFGNWPAVGEAQLETARWPPTAARSAAGRRPASGSRSPGDQHGHVRRDQLGQCGTSGRAVEQDTDRHRSVYSASSRYRDQDRRQSGPRRPRGQLVRSPRHRLTCDEGLDPSSHYAEH